MNTEHERPCAAIVIIAYNDETHIERAIQSACNQTERNIEIICVDDGSTDTTCERMRRCAQRDERIRVVTQPNSGIFGARHAGLRYVTSDYVLYLDSDDVLMPDAVETACGDADKTGADVLEFGVSLVIDESNPPSKETCTYLEGYFSQEKPVPDTDHGPELVNACFAEQGVITWNVWNKLYRKELLQKAFQFYQGEWICMEEDMLLTLMVLCQVRRYARIPAKLYAYTVGGGMTTSAEELTSTQALRRAGSEGLTLKLAREWMKKLGCTQDESASGLEALTGHLRALILDRLLIRVAAEKRSEYLSLLSQNCEKEEFFLLISKAISRQQRQIECLEESRREIEVQNRQLSKKTEAQQAQIDQLEERNRYLSESFDTISNAFFWKITKPARFTLDVMKWAARPHADRGLLRKGLYTLRTMGVRATWQKVMKKIYSGDNAVRAARQAVYTEEELAQQREHRFSKKIKFSIVVPLYNTPERFLRAMIESVLAQTYAGWELCMADGSDAEHSDVERICLEYAEKDSRIRYRKLEQNRGISGNTNACLELAAGDYVGLLDHDDLLHPAALYEVMRTIENTGADFIYTDESTFHETPEDAYLPNFKPAFSPDTLRSVNYICHFTVFKRALLNEVGLFDPACDGSQDHDMVLRLTEKARRVAHIPEILYYWRAHMGSVAESAGVKPYTIEAGVRAVKKQLERLGLEGQVEPVRPGLTVYRTHYAIRGTPKVSILIPNNEHIEDLRKCLNSVFDKTTWPNYEIVIVENNSRSPELFAYYNELQKERGNVRVVTWSGRFNFSAINNYGAAYCTGDYLLLLNNDTEVITPGWIEEMLMFAQRPDVGAVGCMMYYPDDTIQHAGVILGLGGVAGHSHKYCKRNDNGYMNRLTFAQNLSAVTAACMMLRRDVWDTVHGFDEDWAVAFNDVDLCIRIRQAGYLIVWTPFAELYHYESKSRGLEDTSEKKRRFASEVLRFQRRWGKELAAGDPYYNPNLTLDKEDFSAAAVVQKHDAR